VERFSDEWNQVECNSSFTRRVIVHGGPTIQLWDTGTGQKIFTYRGHTATVINTTTSLTWSPDGAAINSADTDGNVLVWKIATGKLLFKYKLD